MDKAISIDLIKCRACGIKGIHACLGAPIKQSDLPEGLRIMESGELTKAFINNAGKATQKKEAWFDAYTGKEVKRYHMGDELVISTLPGLM